MGNVDKRVENLERLYSPKAAYEDPGERARQNAEFAARWTRVEEKARREAEAGNPGRLQALEEVAAYMQNRRENRRP